MRVLKMLLVGLVVGVLTLSVTGCVSTGTVEDVVDAWRMEVGVMKEAAERGRLEADVSLARLKASADSSDESAAERLERAIAALSKKDAEIAKDVAANAGKMETAVTGLATEVGVVVKGIDMMRDAIANPAGESVLGIPVDSGKLSAGALLAIFGNIFLSEKRKKARDVKAAKDAA